MGRKKQEPQAAEGQLSFADDGVGITGQWMLKKADEWIAANGSIWNLMMNKAAELVAQGRRFSMEYLIQFALYDCDARGVTAFKVDNNIRSALRKRMVERYPRWERHIKKRDSKVDWA